MVLSFQEKTRQRPPEQFPNCIDPVPGLGYYLDVSLDGFEVSQNTASVFANVGTVHHVLVDPLLLQQNRRIKYWIGDLSCAEFPPCRL
jgi:hypothetical protein